MKTKLLKNSLLAVALLTASFNYGQEYDFTSTDALGWSESYNGNVSSGTEAGVGVLIQGNDGDGTVEKTNRTLVNAGAIDADTNKYVFITISSLSNANAVRIATPKTGGGFNFTGNLPITNTTGFQTFGPFDLSGLAEYSGMVTGINVQFRKTTNPKLINGDIFIDKIIFQSSMTLSVDENTLATFSISPNPVKNTLNIDSQDTISNVAVYDLLGKEVISSNTVKNTLDVSTLSNGVYVIKLTSDKGVATKKFVKE